MPPIPAQISEKVNGMVFFKYRYAPRTFMIVLTKPGKYLMVEVFEARTALPFTKN